MGKRLDGSRFRKKSPTLIGENSTVLEYVAIDQLRLMERQVRRFKPGHIERLENSLSEFGFVAPLVIDGEDRVIAGAARLQAAGNLGLHRVPVVRVNHLTKAQLRAYRLADNKTGRLVA